jgi:hypothetical protein
MCVVRRGHIDMRRGRGCSSLAYSKIGTTNMRLDKEKIWGRRSIRRNGRRQNCGGWEWEKGGEQKFTVEGKPGYLTSAAFRSWRSSGFKQAGLVGIVTWHTDREQARLVSCGEQKNNGESGSHHVAAKVRIPTPTETSQHDVHRPIQPCHGRFKPQS